MNTMHALGTGPAMSQKGGAPELNLGADSETLALFASLFAMMQTPQTDVPETVAADIDPQMQPETQGPLLPAAAMLMAGLAPSPEMTDPDAISGDMGLGDTGPDGDVTGDAAGLLKLLLAAQDIAAPDHLSVKPTSESKVYVEAVAPVRTATEILTGAIEILKSLEAVPVEDVQDAQVSADARMSANPMLDATIRMVMVPPSSEFVGPMPAVTPSASLPAPAAMLVADPDFIGPMPVVANSVSASPTSVQMTVAAPSSGFVGPMPVVANSISASPTSVQMTAAAPSSGFVGPMPAIVNAAPDGGHTADPDKAVKSDLYQQTVDEDGTADDEGFVHRRADFMVAAKGRKDLASGQQNPADISAIRQRMTALAADTSQGAASSASASVQTLVQQAASSQGTGPVVATGGSDSAQSAMASTTGGHTGSHSGNHSGGHSGGQSGGQQSPQQMADGGLLARGSADRTLLHRLNTDNAGWSETMVKRLTADLRAGVQSVRIILEPQKLGRLNVELGLRRGKASIRISAETQDAARLLSGARGQLGQMLENAGMRLASFQATGAQTDAGLDAGQSSQGRGGEGAGDPSNRNNAGRNQEFSNKIDTALDEPADDAVTGENALREGETAVLSILA